MVVSLKSIDFLAVVLVLSACSGNQTKSTTGTKAFKPYFVSDHLEKVDVGLYKVHYKEMTQSLLSLLPSFNLVTHFKHNAAKSTVEFYSGKKRIKKFKVVSNLSPESLVGSWYTYSNEDGVEYSQVIHRRLTHYDMEYVDLDHEEKSYIQSMDDNNIPYRIIDGFIVDEGGDGFVFVTHISDENIQYIDSTFASRTSEQKYRGQKHVAIPKGYKLSN